MAKFDKTLFLHIGTDKTGTTALQFALSKNDALLSASGVYYPKAGRGDLIHHHMLVAPVCMVAKDRGFTTQKTWDECLADLSSELEQRDEDKVVISSEMLSQGVDFSQLSKILDIFTSVKVVVYLRRQDQYVMSVYEQAVKSLNHCDTFDVDAVTIPDYFQMINSWAEFAGGREHLIVRPYEKNQFIEGSLYADFWHHALAEDFNDAYCLPKKPESNLGLTRDALEFLRLLNVSSAPLWKCEFLGALHAFSLYDEENSCKPFVVKDLLSPTQRLKVLQVAEASNQKVSRVFLKRDDGALFYDDLPDTNSSWKAYPGLAADKALAIARFIYSHNFSAPDMQNIPKISDIIILVSMLHRIVGTTDWSGTEQQDLHASFCEFIEKLNAARELFFYSLWYRQMLSQDTFQNAQNHHGSILDYQNKELSKILMHIEESSVVQIHHGSILDYQNKELSKILMHIEESSVVQSHLIGMLEKQNGILDELRAEIAELRKSRFSLKW